MITSTPWTLGSRHSGRCTSSYYAKTARTLDELRGLSVSRGGSWVETQAEEARFEPGDTALEDDHSATRTAIRTVDYVSSKRYPKYSISRAHRRSITARSSRPITSW